MLSNKNKKKKNAGEGRSILNDKYDFSVIEAYKTIRTNLMFADQNKGCKCIIITSANQGEGKSTTCSNLGITLGQTKAKTLIIDCDMRKPTVHKLFNVKGIPGLSEVLAGMNSNTDVIRETKYTNLHILCGGTIPPNPSELLSSSSMEELIEDLSSRYDYILLDSPPVNLVSDALALSTVADGIVLVVEQGGTTHPDLKRALSSLEFANAKVFGIILNGVDNSGRYGYWKYGYSNRYGYGEKYNNG